jgi:hypothetical protein
MREMVADGDEISNLPELIGKILFVWLYLKLYR